MTKSLLEQGLGHLNLDYNDQTIDRFRQYREIMVTWNKVMNLTSIIEQDEVEVKHFLDSVACIIESLKNEKTVDVIDVGTGAGFPGLPIKIVYDNINITLLDSLNKRINFLNEVVSELGLENVHCIHGRAEDYGKDENYRETYDFCVSRAVADLAVLCEFCMPFVKVGGYFVSQKSKKVLEEVEKSRNAIEILGGEIVEIKEVQVPFLEADRHLVVIKKVKETPEKYPRRSGMPLKKPLT